MEIYEIKTDKKRFLDLLLLADEQEDMVDRYIDEGTMYVLDDGGVKAECVVTDEGGGILEIKNIAVDPACQGRGYGRALIDFVRERYTGGYDILQVGTGDSPLTVPFYEKCGFRRSHSIKNFFTDNYDHPIFECGVQLVDMVYLRMDMKKGAGQMITEYKNGRQLLDEEGAFLETNTYQSAFFYMDAPLLTEPGRADYAFKCTSGNKKLLVLKIRPYSMLLFGDAECCAGAAEHIVKTGLEMENYLCGKDVGDELMRVLGEKYGREYAEVLGMDYMEAREAADPPSPEVEKALPGDLDEIIECHANFIRDCGLSDKVDAAKTAKNLDTYRVIRRGGRIAATVRVIPETDKFAKISGVYTRDEFRGQGLARRAVATAMNEILSSGLIATLNVDRKNPVTNHLYRALGFRPLFSQGEYRPVKK